MIVMNSYVDTPEAEDYFLSRFNATAWTNATIEQKMAALTEATDIIDKLPLTGNKAIKDQELRFPREGQVSLDTDPSSSTYGEYIPSVPQDVKKACCDIALALLEGIDPEEEFMQLSQITGRYANLAKQKNTILVEDHVAAGIPCVRAFRALAKYIRSYQSVHLGRTS